MTEVLVLIGVLSVIGWIIDVLSNSTVSASLLSLPWWQLSAVIVYLTGAIISFRCYFGDELRRYAVSYGDALRSIAAHRLVHPDVDKEVPDSFGGAEYERTMDAAHYQFVKETWAEFAKDRPEGWEFVFHWPVLIGFAATFAAVLWPVDLLLRLVHWVGGWIFGRDTFRTLRTLFTLEDRP